jgi:energy-coupling factor transporter transmembrane protein EcfT
MLVQAVRGMPALAMALECRGFGRAGKRTTFGELKSGRGLALDFCIAAATAAALISPMAFLRT